MWTRRLAVRHWRGLDLEIPALSPHLNLLFGPNEAGKSRLVQALRYALFESSKGRSEHKQALATWGRAAEKPSVSVELELAGTRWRLEKTFLGTGCNTTLRSDRESLEDSAAEDRLAELIGVGQGGRKALATRDLGIWSLLWVEQGESRDAPPHNPTSQARIQDHLTREIGEVAAGELGQDVLRRAEEQRQRFYSAARDAERAPLTESRARVRELAERLQEARARRDAIAADADALDRQRTAERDLVTRVAAAQSHLEEMRVLEHRAGELGQRLEVYDVEVDNAGRELERRRERLERARALDGEIEDLERRLQAAAASLVAAEGERTTVQAAVDEANRLAGVTDGEHADAERRVRALQRRRERAHLDERAERLRDRLREADRVDERLVAIQTQLAELPKVSAADIARLRRTQEARDTARARLEGASASVELVARRDLTVSGEPLPAGARRRVLIEDERQLEVDGLLSITVHPGGGELPRLRDAQRDAEQALRRALEALDATDVATAEQIAQQRRDLDAERERARRELDQHLPDGREPAREGLRELEAALARDPDDAGGPFDPAALAAAETALGSAGERRDGLRARRDAALAQLSAARERAATGRTSRESLERQRDGARQRRAALPEVATLTAELEHADRSWREKVAARDELEREFDGIGGDDIQLDLEQATTAHDQLSHELQQVRVACAGLTARLESAGDDGRHERVQELEAELTRAEDDLARVAGQAAAARRLHAVLLEEYEQARERLAAPVIARVRPYLQSLFPDTEVWLDDDLNLKGLRSADTDQSFEALSGGAREQLALLVRVGLAEVLGSAEPHPLVLDDVLVNTDAERIRLVQRVLYQASRSMQILLFTCHAPLFDGLGADQRIELPAARRPGS